MMRAASRTVISGLALWVSRVFTTSDTLAILYSFDRNFTPSGSPNSRLRRRVSDSLRFFRQGQKELPSVKAEWFRTIPAFPAVPCWVSYIAATGLIWVLHHLRGTKREPRPPTLQEGKKFPVADRLRAGCRPFWCVCRSTILRFLCNPFHLSATVAGFKRVAMYESKPLSQLPHMDTGVLFYLTSPHHKEEH
jgi:hypothetical protein